VPAAPPFWFAASRAALYIANIQAVANPARLGPLLHTWSLSTEEQFYLLWPLCINGLLRARRVWPVLAIALLAAGTRGTLRYGGSPAANYFSPLCRVDQLLIGCALALGFDGLAKWRGVLQVAGLGFILLLLVMARRIDSLWSPYYFGGMTVVALGTTCLIAALLDPSWWLSAVFAARPLVWIGQRSYGIYLFHFPVFVLLERLRVPHSPRNFVAVTLGRIGITLALAAFSWRFVEIPLMRQRDREDHQLGKSKVHS
jgi:peptidoglycan/LPS O-acetylase OafA/YrhL